MSERRPAVAWVAFDHDGEPLAATVEPRAAQHWSHGTLRVARCVETTDAEREAVAFFAGIDWATDLYSRHAAALRGLLQRIGGAT